MMETLGCFDDDGSVDENDYEQEDDDGCCYAGPSHDYSVGSDDKEAVVGTDALDADGFQGHYKHHFPEQKFQFCSLHSIFQDQGSHIVRL